MLFLHFPVSVYVYTEYTNYSVSQGTELTQMPGFAHHAKPKISFIYVQVHFSSAGSMNLGKP